MSSTATEKILARAAKLSEVKYDDIVECEVDLTWITATQISILKEAFDQLGANIWDKERVKLIIDHFVPPRTEPQAKACKLIQDFAREQNLELITDGIKHIIFRERGWAVPGIVMAGNDSHTNTSGAFGAFAAALGPTETAVIFTKGKIWFKVPQTIQIILEGGPLHKYITARDVGMEIFKRIEEKSSVYAQYKTIEITGSALKYLNISERMTLANMSTELGAKNCFIEPDDVIENHIKNFNNNLLDNCYFFKSDEDADFFDKITINLDSIDKPLISIPESPTNVIDINKAEGIKLDQVFIGACLNGQLEDLRLTADILRGNKIHPQTRLIVTPSSRKIYKEAFKEGLIEIFLDAGAIIGTPGCSVCTGLEGSLADGQTCFSTSSRNFIGRMGSNKAKIYLGSPAVAAISALNGEITNPQRKRY